MRVVKKMVPVLAVVGFFAVAVAPALAQPVWESCAETSEGEREKGCATEKAGEGEYEWLALEENVTILGRGSLEFGDSKASSGELRVKCSTEISGTAGTEGEGAIKTVALTSCSVVKGTCESPKVTAVHLPWKTALAESEGKDRDDIENSGSGLPGYMIACGSGSKTEDTCEFEKTSVGLENLTTENLVEAKFDSSSGKATCNHAEKCPMRSATGTVEGSFKIEADQKGIEGLRVAKVQPVISAVRQKGNGGRQRKECTFAETDEKCVIRVSAFLNPFGLTLKISSEKLKKLRGAESYDFVIPGAELGGLRECQLGLKLVNNAGRTEVSCALEVIYEGPKKPAANEFEAIYEVQAEEEGGAMLKTPTSRVLLTTG